MSCTCTTCIDSPTGRHNDIEDSQLLFLFLCFAVATCCVGVTQIVSVVIVGYLAY